MNHSQNSGTRIEALSLSLFSNTRIAISCAMERGIPVSFRKKIDGAWAGLLTLFLFDCLKVYHFHI